MCKLLAFSGSLRANSYNQAILDVAVQAAQEAGAKVTSVKLADHVAPLFSEDYEASNGMPEQAKALKQLMLEADGFLIASPEYNSSYSAALKNALDWASRMDEGEKPLQPFRGKSATIMAASPGALGGLRGLVPLRMLLGNLGMHVAPTQHAIGSVSNLVDENNKIVDEGALKKLRGLGRQAVELTVALRAK